MVVKFIALQQHRQLMEDTGDDFENWDDYEEPEEEEQPEPEIDYSQPILYAGD